VQRNGAESEYKHIGTVLGDYKHGGKVLRAKSKRGGMVPRANISG
jgi:hypothetical protein